MPFVTPRNISTLQLSRLDYNNSLIALLENFASPTKPLAQDVNIDGIPGLRPGMLWYQSGSNTTLGQGRLFIYTGTKFTRDGLASLTFPTLNSANVAVAQGHLEEGELLLVSGDKMLYKVYQGGIEPISSDESSEAKNANTLNYLSSSQFMRSDVDQSFAGQLTGDKMVTLSNTTINSKTVAALRLSGATGTILIDSDGSKRITWNDAPQRSFVLGSGVYYNSGEKFTNTGSGAATVVFNNDADHGKIEFKIANKGTAESPVLWTQTLELSNTGLKLNSNVVWHAGNDGHTSGLDADLLDGKQLTTIENEYKANDASTLLSARSNDYSTYTTLNSAISNVSSGSNAAIALKADKASPTFTGVPAAPTPSAATNTTQIATTAFTHAAISADVTKPFVDALNVNASTVGGVGIANIVRKDTNSTVNANVTFSAGKKAQFGSYGEILNDGNFYIDNLGVGDLFIRNRRNNGIVNIDTANATGSIKTAVRAGGITSSVELNFNGIKKLETTNTGVKVTGETDTSALRVAGNTHVLVSGAHDNTSGRITTVGYAGIGNVSDWRVGSRDAYEPYQLYGTGLTFGFGRKTSLGYSGGSSYASIISGMHWNDSSGRAGMSQIIISEGNMAVRGVVNDNTWSSWNYVVYDNRSISTGDGLSGGGNLSANRTISVDSSVVRTSGSQTIGGAKTFTDPVTAKGRIIVPPISGVVGAKELRHDSNGDIGIYDAGNSTWRLKVSPDGMVSSAGNIFAGSANTLTTARSINGTAFDGSQNITTTTWGTARNITIGATTKSVNGSAAVSWTAAELGVNIALDTSGTLPVNRGGTGGTTAADARTNLGLGSLATKSSVDLNSDTTSTLTIERGGTSATNATNARTNLGIEFATESEAKAGSNNTKYMTPLRVDQHFKDGNLASLRLRAISDTTGTLDVARGGTGGTTASAALSNLGVVFATEAQAKTGTDNTTYMTPLRVDQRFKDGNIADLKLRAISDTTGTLGMARGGTGATTPATARTALGLGTAATKNTGTASGEVPLNSNLGSAAYVNVEDIGLQAYKTTIGDNANNVFNLTHSLNSMDLLISVRDTVNNKHVYPDITYTSVNAVAIEFAYPPAVGQYRVSVVKL